MSDVDVRGRVSLPPAAPLHARTAAELVRETSRFRSTVTLLANDRRANGKSILEILALGAVGGTELSLLAVGDDAAEAVARLTAFIATLG